ncbi:AAA family ATPase, partial [Arthrobacter sp. JCM 19049]|uniref:AAA family ATPase n=1 Tax=Arthrobacter sp. JCM 19049 TaxID=1460643 RepID=UPI000A98CB50
MQVAARIFAAQPQYGTAAERFGTIGRPAPAVLRGCCADTARMLSGRAGRVGCMLQTLAISGYRSVRDLVIELAPLTVITGANAVGKSNVYRALKLISELG